MTTQQNSSPISALGLAIWALAALFFLYEFFLRTFIGSVATQVIPDLHLNAETFAVVGSAYYIAYGVMQVPVGILADRFGVKNIMTFAVLVCVASAFLFAHADSFASAFFARLVMGFGSSFAFVCLLVIVVTWLPREFFGFFSGASQFLGTMGPLLAGGPLIALMHKTHQNWRTLLDEIAIVGIVLAVLIALIVREKPRSTKQETIVLTRSEPLLSRLAKLARNGQAWAVALYSATLYISMTLLGAIWGTHFLQIQGLSQATAASIISVAWLGYALGCPLVGVLSDIAKRRKPTLIICAAIGLLCTSIVTYVPLHESTLLYTILFFFIGFACSGQNVGFAAISEHSDVSTKATALGLNNGLMTLFGAFVPPLASYFIYLSAGARHDNLLPNDFMLGFSLMPVCNAISLLMAIFAVKETYCKPQKETIKLRV